LRVRGGEEGAEIRLRRGVQAVLTVVDADGAPVRGAQVQAVPGTGQVPWSERRRFAPVSTDARGVARLPALDADQRHQLTVWPPSDAFAPLQRADWLPRDETLRLDRRLAVAGFVRDRAGQPVVGAVVSVEVAPGNSSGAATDEQGRFQVTGVQAGEVLVRVSLGGPWLAEARVRAGATDAVLVIDPGLSLVAHLEGAQAWGTQASLHILRGGAWTTIHRNASPGAPLRFQGLEPGDLCTLWVPPNGPTADSARSALVTGLRPGAEVKVRLAPGQSIRGRLALPAGARNFAVRATREGGVDAWGQVQDDGRYEIWGLPEGRWTVTATAQTPSGMATGEAVADAGGTADVDLKPVPR
jgi:hypothetical protein